MRLLGIDIETTGFNFKEDEITEIGMVVKDWPRKKPLLQETIALHEENYPPITDEIKMLTGITLDHLLEVGLPPRVALERICSIVEEIKPQYFVAHNGKEFDKPFLEEKFEQFDLTFPSLPWVDTKTDVPYPKTIRNRSLVALAAEHGFLNPFPHDALADVNTMFKILEQYDLEVVLARSKERTVTLEALVNYDTRDLAKERGYHWIPDKKKWQRIFRESEAILESSEAPFKVREVFEK